MEQKIWSITFALIWPIIYLGIIIFGKKSSRLKNFRDAMIKGYKAPLAITLIYYLGAFLGTLNPICLLSNITGVIDNFCLSSLGLTMAQSINGFEPLPAVTAVKNKKKIASTILSTLIFALLLMVLDIFIGIFTSYFFPIIFHETVNTAQAVQSIPGANIWLSFFVLLSGAGIAEEGIFRLFLLTFFWKITKRPWIAIIISSLCFGLYHLTPIDSLYQVFWQYPLTQVASVFVSGLLYGFFYVKKGFGTNVLGHTFSDWFAVLYIALK